MVWSTLLICVVLVSLYFVLDLALSVALAVGHLAKKPKEGEARFSGQRILTAFAPLAGILFLVAGVVGLFWYSEWKREVQKAKRRETRQLIEDNIERLAANVDEDGRFVQPLEGLLDVDDRWGNPLRVDYEESLWHGLLSVRSDGPDEQQDTADDLASSRRIARPKVDIAKDALGKAKDAILDRTEEGD